MIELRSYVLAAAGLATIYLSSTVSMAKQDTAPPNAPPPLSEAERSVGLRGVQFSDVIEAKGKPTVADGLVRKDGVLVSISYVYRYTAIVTEDVKGFSFTVGGVQAPAGSPGYYAGSFISSLAYSRNGQQSPMDMWCFLPSVAGGKRENICLLRNNPKRAAIAPTRMNPYLWDHFSPMTGTFDYVNTPIFKREAIELPFKPVLEYHFQGWTNDIAVLRLYTMGSFVSQMSVAKNAKGEYRLRTVGGDFLLRKEDADPNAARITPVASEPPMVGSFVRVKLTIDADSRASNCEVLESDAPKELQDKSCEILRRTGKFSVSSTTIVQTVRFQMPAE